MKRILLISQLTLLFLSSDLSAHKQRIHQYLVLQGYSLLRGRLGTDVPALQTRIGGTDPFYIGQRPWQRRYITTGSLKVSMKAGASIGQTVEEDEKSSAWLSLGVGASYFGLTFGESFSYNYHNNVFTLRYLKADEFQFNVEGDYDNPALRFREIGFLYGRVHREDYLVLSLSVGMSLINGVDRGKQINYREYERRDISGYGIPFEAKFRFEIGRIGVGGSWFGNINLKKSFSGAMLEMHLKIF